ncbi:hypothetical protein PR048_020298 [Dryococelus australis]|uniref:PiggyBac transposable element-derived protein domain-containing protein n=1 Tax=Dryococelus australis TaxID=614101 RepID=A0ABQ9H5W7_9NEOP|nr:hypothetical protein PR048_020298 [Dryococelus australis]
MARCHELTTEQALWYFKDVCETTSGSENSDNDLSSSDEYIPLNSDNGENSDEEPEVFQDAEQASQMEVEEVELATQDDRSQAMCSRQTVCSKGSSRCNKIRKLKQTKPSSLKKMPPETATVVQPQGSVLSVQAGLLIVHTEVAKDGTEWEVIDFGNNLRGRRGAQNVLREKVVLHFTPAADVDPKYLVNGFPLVKEDDRPCDQLLGINIVICLLEPYLQCGRNFTMDNLIYLSITVSGTEGQENKPTVNRIRMEVLPTAKNFKQQLYATYVYKHKDTTLRVYQAKVDKNVILLSSLHPSVNIAEKEKKTTETIQYYNATKFGVDIMNQMARKYSVKSASRHWTVHVFFNVLDLACSL